MVQKQNQGGTPWSRVCIRSKLFNVHIQELVIGAQLESQAGQVRWKTKNVSLIVVVYLRKRPFYWLLCPTLKSTWLRLISLDKCEGEARVSSRKGKVLFKVQSLEILCSRNIQVLFMVLFGLNSEIWFYYPGAVHV